MSKKKITFVYQFKDIDSSRKFFNVAKANCRSSYVLHPKPKDGEIDEMRVLVVASDSFIYSNMLMQDLDTLAKTLGGERTSPYL